MRKHYSDLTAFLARLIYRRMYEKNYRRVMRPDWTASYECPSGELNKRALELAATAQELPGSVTASTNWNALDEALYATAALNEKALKMASADESYDGK